MFARNCSATGPTIERDGLITATAALYPYSNEQAELACVAVDENYRATGRGSQLLEQIEMEAKKRKLKRLFVLTTRTAHWFVEHGFVAGEVSELPAVRQMLASGQLPPPLAPDQAARRCKACSLSDRCQPQATHACVAAARAALFDPDA